MKETRFVNLLNRSRKCSEAAERTKDEMKEIWKEKALQLQFMALNLTLAEAQELVEG